MDKDFAKIKDLFVKLRTKKVLYVKNNVSPSSDWFKMLTYTFLLMIISSLFSLYFYKQIKEGNFFSSSENGNSEKTLAINQDLLDKIIKNLEERVSVKEGVLKSTPQDPSL